MPRWLASALLVALIGPPAHVRIETIAPNDNRQAVGRLANGVLTVALEARTGVWYPEGDHGPSVETPAFGEVGKPISTPGPLLRAAMGVTIRGTVRNRLDKPLILYGLGKARGFADSTIVPVNGVTSFSFTASTPGTYYYAAKRGDGPFGGRDDNDAQLQGVIIVDPPNVKPDPAERTFAITWFCPIEWGSQTGLSRCTMALNGLSWPHTERLTYTQGDSVHWRVLNFTSLDHPMHLHGFYFRTDSKGDGIADSLYTTDQQRLGVTEVLGPYQTMTLAWQAARPGNWIYHCHYAVHVSDLLAFDAKRGTLDSTMLGHHMSDRPHQMFGLVIGMTVQPKGPQVVSTGPARAIRLLQREKPNVYGSQPGMSYVVDGSPEVADPNALSIPGPTLVLERNKPVAVTIVNQSKDHAAVHWHGIELESYPDGVPGWSGSGTNLLPSIPPNDSLTVRWTPPRAGSFMYHSHFREAQQMGSGLYGPIIVVEPGQRFDPETDRILFFGTAGRAENVVFGPYPKYLMNGKEQPEPMTLNAGTRYRFRLFNLAGDAPTFVSINAGDKPIEWRAVAKDGHDLPPSQATIRPATLVFDPGEIYDFELTPSAAGELALTFGPPPGPPPPPPTPGGPVFQPLPPTITVPIHVR